MPRFSIVVVDYQGVNSHEIYCRGIGSLLAQTFTDYEILAYHDGPFLNPKVDWPIPVTCSAERHNDFGHSLRDRGIREARGEYIVHFNADNILYPNALAELEAAITRPNRIFGNGQPLDNNSIVIFPVIMHGLQRIFGHVISNKNFPEWFSILTGEPPVKFNIDAMQLVMKRELWLAEGGWYDRTTESDGNMYPKFAQKYGYRLVGPVLGEHF